jgi:hypothetical protein
MQRGTVVALQKPAIVAISPSTKATAIAWLLTERDAKARTMAKLRMEIDRLDATLAECTGQGE